jgi:hypothetical protein
MDKGFTQIPNWYWECGLTLLEVNIVARIASWQREGKEFYESMEVLAPKFGVSYNTIRRSFELLIKENIILKNGKHKRMWKYVINQGKLNSLKKDTAHRGQLNDNNSPQRAVLQPTKGNYNTTKTSNKTSFREGEDKGSSLPNPEELKAWMQNLDI